MSNRRALYKRNSIGSHEQLRERRVVLDESLRKKHREQLISAKRFRHLSRREFNENDQVQALANDLKSNEQSTRMEAAQYLSKFLVEPCQALITYITHGDCIETLTRMMSDIAAGPHDLWAKSITTVPYMVSFLDSENLNLREAAAGALGNMAAEDLGDMTSEDDEVRTMIRNNGAIPPLVRLLDSNDSRLVQTACFALANLARGNERQLNEFIVAAIGKPLFRHLRDETPDTVTEVCWVMSYLTAGSQQFRQQIMQQGIANILVRELRNLCQQGPVVLPLLRTLGNLCGGPDEYIEVFIDQEGFLFTLLLLTHSEHRQRPDIVKKVVDANAIAYLTDILVQHGALDIRKGAATCLLNIAYHGEKYMLLLPHQQLLPAFVDLVQSQDAEEMRLGLSYVEMLLTRVPRGNEVVQVTPGCVEALGAVNPVPDPELYAFANNLVDKFYEETPGLQGF
ncbi:armadillo-type protein [Phascolomyces articulosus]|uniref:Armadillo-type protein n=1 Tax=Phascolomyces articulosus TaxID=60185 RepID=A0AAD5KLM8_9FUNG|nr:armadillo-type protein [Phascolomyces articulosus]